MTSTPNTAAMAMVLVAKVTEKKTGHVWHIYRTQSESRAGKSHYVYVCAGRVEGCSCEDRRYHPGRYCKHMQAIFNTLKNTAKANSLRQTEQDQKTLARSLAQQAEKTPALATLGSLSDNRGFSLMRR